MANKHSDMQEVALTDRCAYGGRPIESDRAAIVRDRQPAWAKGKPRLPANGTAKDDVKLGRGRYTMNKAAHARAVFGKTGTTMIKLWRRMERLAARAPARIDIEADIQAATAILSEPDIWERDSTLAQEAMIALWHVYGPEVLVLAPPGNKTARTCSS